MTRKRAPESSDVPGVEDALAFRAAVRDVKPLEQMAKPAGLEIRRTPRARKRAAPAAIAAADMPLVEDDRSAQPVAGADILAFRRAGVRDQVVRRLRRGLYPIEDELDLHGLTQTEARDHLADFLARSRDTGRRCVRIIHGKGYRSGARGPILKIAVNAWLRRHLDVMAFSSARAIDGGTGAVYVLLRAP